MGRILDIEAALLSVFARDPHRWFSTLELAHLLYGWDEAPPANLRAKPVAVIRHALARLKNTGFVFQLGRFPSEQPGPGVPPYQMMWGPPEAVVEHARLVERQLGARWVDTELLQAARDELSARSAKTLAQSARHPPQVVQA